MESSHYYKSQAWKKTKDILFSNFGTSLKLSIDTLLGKIKPRVTKTVRIGKQKTILNSCFLIFGVNRFLTKGKILPSIESYFGMNFSIKKSMKENQHVFDFEIADREETFLTFFD